MVREAVSAKTSDLYKAKAIQIKEDFAAIAVIMTVISGCDGSESIAIVDTKEQLLFAIDELEKKLLNMRILADWFSD